LSEDDKKKLKELINKMKDHKKIDISLLKEFKTLEITKQRPLFFNNDSAARQPELKQLEK
jgi:hypothetical protein